MTLCGLLFDDMYTDIKSVVMCEGEVSRPFGEWQGIRQGGSSWTGNYKAGKNKILAQQDKNPAHRTSEYHPHQAVRA